MNDPFTPFTLITHDFVDSTNDEAARLIRQGTSDNVIVMARQQSKGRGRQGRHWVSEPGNLYCSFVIRPFQPVKDFPLYSFVMAVAARETVQHFLAHQTIQVKWPNDILANGRKIAGILLEVAGDALVIGTGINCARFPRDAAFPATSLKTEGIAAGPLKVLEILAGNFNDYRKSLDQDGFGPVQSLWWEHAYRKNGNLTVAQNNEAITGQFVQLADDGAMILDVNGIKRRITAGDVMEQ